MGPKNQFAIACILLPALLLTNLPSSLMAQLPPPAADATGMVPGDIVFGNMNTYPGHVGIYVGKWEALPESLRAQYKQVFDQVLIRSRDPGLKDSFLVVDSDGGRGCRLASFVEQFTGYLPKGARSPNLKAALEWESKNGAAVRWQGVGDSDPRRWQIVEEALKAAAAKVPYDGSHGQWETTILGGNDYPKMSGLDCISLVHVVYHRAAGIDLDVSLKVWHEPGQLYGAAKQKGLLRKDTNLKPVLVEAAISGNWRMKIRTIKSGSDFKINGEFPVNLATAEEQLQLSLLDEKTLAPVPRTQPQSVPIKYRVADSGDVDIIITDREATAAYTKAEFRVNAKGQFQATLAGVDDDGPFELSIRGAKIFQMRR